MYLWYRSVWIIFLNVHFVYMEIKDNNSESVVCTAASLVLDEVHSLELGSDLVVFQSVSGRISSWKKQGTRCSWILQELYRYSMLLKNFLIIFLFIITYVLILIRMIWRNYSHVIELEINNFAVTADSHALLYYCATKWRSLGTMWGDGRERILRGALFVTMLLRPSCEDTTELLRAREREPVGMLIEQRDKASRLYCIRT